MHGRSLSLRRSAVALLAAAGLVGAASAAPAPAASAQPSVQPAAVAPRDATLATALSGTIRCPLNRYYPELGCGRMKNGKLRLRPGNSSHAHIEIKDIETRGRRTSVRLIDVAGTKHKEAVVIISANAGGVSWPNYVAVYDGNGRLLTTWDTGDAIAVGRKGGASGAREFTSFSRTTRTSVDLRVGNIATGRQAECCGTGTDVYRLSKGKNGKPVFRLITRRN